MQNRCQNINHQKTGEFRDEWHSIAAKRQIRAANSCHIPQATVWLASQTLRILHAKPAGTSLLSAKKMPLTGHLFWRARGDRINNLLSFLTPFFWWGRGFELMGAIRSHQMAVQRAGLTLGSSILSAADRKSLGEYPVARLKARANAEALS